MGEDKPKLKSEPIFRVSSGSRHNACLNFLDDQVEGYVQGYKRAAQILVDYVVKYNRYHDTLVYPIMFSFRQYLKLRFKYIIKSGSILLEKPVDFPKKHQLDQLWRMARRVIQEVWSGESLEELRIIDDLVLDFSALDQLSDGFRYPTHQDGAKTLSKARHIDLEEVRRLLEKVGNLLDGADEGIQHSLDNLS